MGILENTQGPKLSYFDKVKLTYSLGCCSVVTVLFKSVIWSRDAGRSFREILSVSIYIFFLKWNDTPQMKSNFQDSPKVQ